jgi:acetoin utilization deacetylase AcuC-like enzyme
MASRILVTSLGDRDHHDTGRGHPERPARIDAVVAGIADASLDGAVTWAPARAADHEALARVHDPRYLEAVERFAAAGGGHLDSDTPVSPGSFDTATLAAGCGLVAIDALDRGNADAAFVAVRPPGHHATREHGQGFCLLNNIAVAGAALAERGERVLILDWDVHHGNGTQDIFWDDPRVLYVSTHQSPFYPGTGSASETGGASAAGTTINFPFPAGATGDAALAAIDEVVAPAVESFSPTWVLVSAGFDAHRDDPLANLAWSAGDYALLARRVGEFAPERGRLVAFLEGGYDLDALRRSVAATVSTMAGNVVATEPPTAGGPGRATVDLVARIRAEKELADT